MRIEFTIQGEPASKANSRKLVVLEGRRQVVKSKKAQMYARRAWYQIPPAARQMLECPVRVTLHIYYASERSDLDESLILDLLQAQYSKRVRGMPRYVVRKGVYLNDRQVREKHVYHYIDRKNPRAVIAVEPLRGASDG